MSKLPLDPKIRFLLKVRISAEGCWEWLGALDAFGYGHFELNGEGMRAHRAAYILFVGPIPDRIHVHHVCANRACVRWDHFSPLTCEEHARITNGDPGRNRAKTHCARGHEFTPENTYVSPSGHRECRECQRLRYREGPGKGPGSGSQWRKTTHCPKGHEYNDENTYVNTKGSRVCRACRKERYWHGRNSRERET